MMSHLMWVFCSVATQTPESVLDRTRRLFYVCCSRALKDLAVVLFVPDVAAARAAVTAAQLFPEVAIRELHELI